MTRVRTPGICNDWPDRPGCLRMADDRFTMRFDDIGEAPIEWCAHCGPEAHAIDKLITKAMKERPGFKEKFAEAIDQERAKEAQ